jgi:ATP-dependent DNA ligase
MPLRICNVGREGIVSKRIDRAYGARKCAHWIKIKNPAHAADGRAESGMRLFARADLIANWKILRVIAAILFVRGESC